jgi:hypothetical protein
MTSAVIRASLPTGTSWISHYQHPRRKKQNFKHVSSHVSTSIFRVWRHRSLGLNMYAILNKSLPTPTEEKTFLNMFRVMSQPPSSGYDVTDHLVLTTCTPCWISHWLGLNYNRHHLARTRHHGGTGLGPRITRPGSGPRPQARPNLTAVDRQSSAM